MGSLFSAPKPPKPAPPVRDMTEVAETEVETDAIAEARRRVSRNARSKKARGRASLRIPLQSGGVNTGT